MRGPKEHKAPISTEWREDIRQAVEVMNRGGVILYPTDTIWGIGCDATNAEAVKKVYDIKKRADSKALITLVDSEAKVEFYIPDIPAAAWDLMDVADKPLTLIFDRARNLAENLLAEDGSLGLRITKEPFSKELCFRMRKAIVSTSANISGEPSPRNFSDISDEIKKAVDYICTSRREEKQNPPASGIIKITASSEVTIIR